MMSASKESTKGVKRDQPVEWQPGSTASENAALTNSSLSDLVNELKRRIHELETRLKALEEDAVAKDAEIAELRFIGERAAAFAAGEPMVEDDEDQTVIDLFSNEELASPEEAVQRCKDIYGLDLVGFIQPRLFNDPLAMARTVNFIRTRVAAGAEPSVIVQEVLHNKDGWQRKEEYLKPFLGGNDPMLWWGDAFSEFGDGVLESEEEDEDEDEDSNDDNGDDGDIPEADDNAV